VDEEWAWSEEDYVTWELTIIVVVQRTGALAIKLVPVEGDEDEESTLLKEDALLIFRSRLEAQAYREETKQFAGYGIVGVDEARIAGLLGRYDLRWVAMADSWDENGVATTTTFDGDRFLKLLGEGIKD
jgi:hypothetical protein